MNALLMVLLFWAGAAGPVQPAPQYFTDTREIRVSAPQRQNYLVVDVELWAHARPDLGDLRIYDDQQEIPYALVVSRGSHGAPNWTDLPAQVRTEQSGRATVITWASQKNVPLGRIAFAIAPENVNFRRPVTLYDGDGARVAAGQLARVHLETAGKVIHSEDLTLDVAGVRSSSFKIVIDNGDDRPLNITGVHPFSRERRVYFDPRGRTLLQLFYGDLALDAPTYDYAKLFQEDPNAAAAHLGPDIRNPAYTGRPDERPWTERHTAVLWAVLVLAVVGLGAIAVRALRA